MTVEAALAAMDTAEQLARRVTENDGDPRFAGVVDLMRDRLRLIARDRATLERHARVFDSDRCDGCWHPEAQIREPKANPGWWPCHEARAVIGYWQEDA